MSSYILRNGQEPTFHPLWSGWACAFQCWYEPLQLHSSAKPEFFDRHHVTMLSCPPTMQTDEMASSCWTSMWTESWAVDVIIITYFLSFLFCRLNNTYSSLMNSLQEVSCIKQAIHQGLVISRVHHCMKAVPSWWACFITMSCCSARSLVCAALLWINGNSSRKQ